MKTEFFPPEEYAARLAKVRGRMAALGLEALLVTAPENIYYLVGLNHDGYFGFHLLIVPREGELCLVTRAMERVTIEHQVANARFVGYADGVDRAAVVVQALRDQGFEKARLGLEKGGLYFPPRLAEGIVAGLPEASWVEAASDLVDEIRAVKSPREVAYTRQAAAVGDAMMAAALATARAGIGEHEIAAEVLRAMALAGGEAPGFGPFIRSTPRLGEEHTTWNRRVLEPGDTLFLELSGSVQRYHAPMGRIVFVDRASAGAQAVAEICREAFAAVVAALKPGAVAAEVYRAWQDCVDRAGLSHYRRHHCGYLVGIAFPPTWTGGSSVVSLRHDSPMVVQEGMVFHLLSWLMGCGKGDYFASDPVVITANGAEVLSKTSQELRVV